jgi:hypothetical protein
MTAASRFVLSLLLTIAFLGFVVVTGRRAQRRAHLTFVALALLALGVTIWCAVELGDHFDLDSAGFVTPMHLGLAKFTTLAYVAPLVLGFLTTRDRKWFSWHRRAAYAVLLLTLLTTITGTWMLLAAERLPAPVHGVGRP